MAAGRVDRELPGGRCSRQGPVRPPRHVRRSPERSPEKVGWRGAVLQPGRRFVRVTRPGERSTNEGSERHDGGGVAGGGDDRHSAARAEANRAHGIAGGGDRRRNRFDLTRRAAVTEDTHTYNCEMEFDAETSAPAAPLDFVREIVVEDQRTGRHGGRVHTRVPPEPNGYLQT